jgi:hypothetical protein
MAATIPYSSAPAKQTILCLRRLQGAAAQRVDYAAALHRHYCGPSAPTIYDWTGEGRTQNAFSLQLHFVKRKRS